MPLGFVSTFLSKHPEHPVGQAWFGELNMFYNIFISYLDLIFFNISAGVYSFRPFWKALDGPLFQIPRFKHLKFSTCKLRLISK